MTMKGLFVMCVAGEFGLAAWGAAVPSDRAALVLEGRTLADVQANWLSGRSVGRITFPGQYTGFHAAVLESAGGCPVRLRVEMQISDSQHLKCVVLELSEGEGGVWGRAVAARYVPPPQPDLGVYRFVNADGSLNGLPMKLTTDERGDGYGVRDLALMPREVRGGTVDASPEADPSQVEAARGVIARFAGEAVARSLRLELIPAAPGGFPVFEIADGGRTLRASNGATLAKAFYADVTRKGAGHCSWSGNRFDAAAWAKPMGDLRVVSPFRRHLYMQPCTASYSTAFWDRARWMREIDWMALHGFDMPYAPIAYEAIAERVWRAEGLDEKEIDAAFAAPAYLAFSRMGCMGSELGALPRAWREREIGLQHAVLARLRALGMEPIVQGFAGVVPDGFRRVHPEAPVSPLRWLRRFETWFLHPDDPLFRRIGTALVREWEREFGRCTYYACDSFIEMSHSLPWREAGHEAVRKGLAESGRNIYGALRDANPDAVWALQDWIFLNGEKVWTKDLAAAFLSGAPADKLLVLEMCADYVNRANDRRQWFWDGFDGFSGRRWAMCSIPVFGGNTIPAGNLPFYANGHLVALASPNRGSLFAYGTLSEAIEVCDVVFELISCAGWSGSPIDLDAWLADYSRARWGVDGAAAADYWRKMRAGSYRGSVEETHDVHFAWQCGRFDGKPGDVGAHLAALEAMRALAPEAGTNALFRADFAVQAAHEAGHVAEVLLRRGGAADADLAFRLLEGADAVLAGHPTHDLRNWLAGARAAAAGDAKLADYYESGARRIVTMWGRGYLDDYAARVWSGLVKGYQLERMRRLRVQRETGRDQCVVDWQNRWIDERMPIAPPTPGWTSEKLAAETLSAIDRMQ